MIHVTGNEEIPFEERKYSILTWEDTSAQELIWGSKKFRKPEGTYVSSDGRMYSIENICFVKSVYLKLQERYLELVKGLPSEDKVTKMMDKVVNNCETWPEDKTGRWVGYVQCLLIEVEEATTVDAERDFTRPLFHKMYAQSGINIPESVQI